MKVYTRCGMSKITIGITGLREYLGRDDGIEEPNRGPSFLGKGFVNPLNPNGGQHQFSPNHIHRLSRDLVMRINKLITQEKML